MWNKYLFVIPVCRINSSKTRPANIYAPYTVRSVWLARSTTGSASSRPSRSWWTEVSQFSVKLNFPVAYFLRFAKCSFIFYLPVVNPQFFPVFYDLFIACPFPTFPIMNPSCNFFRIFLSKFLFNIRSYLPIEISLVVRQWTQTP